MQKPALAEINAFVAIADRLSFAKAAGHLGVSRSSLSETLRGFEEKLGVRLLNRTTRSVALTDAGVHLLAQLRPLLNNLDVVLESVNDFREKPAGQLRLTMPRPAAKAIIAPVLAKFLLKYPAIALEIAVDSALTDIVRARFDAGIRSGNLVEKDMVAFRVGEDARPTIVASPGYLAQHSTPAAPRHLLAHNCIRMRFASGAIAKWTFERRGKSQEVPVTGSLITSDGDLAVQAALDGLGIARAPLASVEAQMRDKRLVPLLEDWMPASVGFYFYYSSRRQVPAALQALIEFLKRER